MSTKKTYAYELLRSSWRSGCLALFCATLAACTPGEGKLKDYDIGGNFTLTDHHGRAFQLQEHLNRNPNDPVLLFFGFTHCPDVCPQTLSRLSRAMSLLGDDGPRVLTLLVTVDPKRDDPAALKAYLEKFPLRAVGLTGTEEQIRPIAGTYAVNFYESHQPAGPDESAGHAGHAPEQGHAGNGTNTVINHSPQTFLIDPQGKVRYFFRPTDSPREIADTVRLLL